MTHRLQTLRPIFVASLLLFGCLAIRCVTAQTIVSTVVEYLNTDDFPNAVGGHFFYSADPAEQAQIDAGAAGRFRRTGFSFNAGGNTDLCRFYGSVSPGPNSHFFTAVAAECAALRAQQITPRPAAIQQWNYEGNGFKVVAPVNGNCPVGTLPVFRAYNNGFTRGFDSNHRFSTSVASLKVLVAQGWADEGLAFCSLQQAGLAPLLGEALTCGTLGSAGGLSERTQPLGLQRRTIDVSEFPDARCNDGSAATFYFRPYVGAENRDKWLVQLKGGGSCWSPDDCAERYCSVDTAFGIAGTSSAVAPQRGINALGIMSRTGEVAIAGNSNPWEKYNQVFVLYCSSDQWVGTAKDVPMTGVHPITKAPLSYRTHFLGSRIVDAVIAELRQTSRSTLVYTLSTPATPMPDLDAAEEFVLAGGSGGGNGTTQNLDRIAGVLKAASTRCAGGACPAVRGLIDSAFTPPNESLDYQYTEACTKGGICSAEAEGRFEESSGRDKSWKSLRDQSCVDFHRPLNSTWRCIDNSFVIQNHVTTPFFVRMGLIDENSGPKMVEARFAFPGKGPMTLNDFALAVKANLTNLENIKATALEKSAIQTIPGAFGPFCSHHETLRGPEAFGVSVQANNQTYRMSTLFDNWTKGTGLFNLTSSTVADTKCE